MDQAEALLIGGRAGVGKTTVSWEISALLRSAEVPHALIDGDFMSQVHPAPPDDPHLVDITTANLKAVWTNYSRLGHRRLIYVNTMSVMPASTGIFEQALAPDVRLIRVLLTATDPTTRSRLEHREQGSELESEWTNSRRKARLLEEGVPADTVRVATDGRSVAEIAGEVVGVTGWGV
ncbi:hypothetical protein ACVNF4_02565 [Streptomyces sp. S6]